jgi:bla regulator protein blaR1
MKSTTLAGDSFSWVLQTSWQAAVLVLLVLIVQMIFRHKLSPAWRYRLWLLVVVRLLLPSAPQTACSIFNVVKLPPPLARVESASLPRTPVPPLPSADEEAKPVLQSPIGAFDTPANLRSDQAELLPGIARGNLTRATILDWHRVAVLVWLLGSCFFATRLLWSNLRFWLRIAAEPAVTNEPARRQLDACRSELGIRRAVDLIETEEVESPSVHGLWRKRLLLPKGIFDRFSAEQMRCIFLHELAHIKRRDLEVNWLASVLQALHWFNPLVLLGFARMRADREMACDALALGHLGKAASESYGDTIIKVVENLVRPPSAPGLLALSEDKRQLEERIRMIAAFRKGPGLSVLALSLIAGIGVVGLTDASRALSSTAAPGDLGLPQSTNLVVRIDANGNLTLGQTAVTIEQLRTNLLAELAKHPKLLRPAPHKVGDIVADSDWSILPRPDVYEVGASKLDLSSIRELPPSGFRALKEPEAIHFTGAYYSCPSGKRPYLIRAVYARSGFGQFRAERRGSSLAIVWGAPLALQIARSGEYQSSAVVVNLDFTPDEVYTELSCVP